MFGRVFGRVFGRGPKRQMSFFLFFSSFSFSKMDKRGDCLTFFALASILMFTQSLPCKVEITPPKAIAALNGSDVSVTCQVNCSSGNRLLSIYEQKRNNGSFQNTELLNDCTAQHDENNITTDCSGVVDMYNNGSFIYCIEVISGSHSIPIEVLVQDSLDAVTDFNVRKINATYLKISWSPVFAYEGLAVYYDVSLNETFCTTTNNNWTVFNTSELDSCQFARLNITSFINTTDQMLRNTSQWSIPIETPPPLVINDTRSIMIMSENGSVLLNITFYFKLQHCVCPGRTNGVSCTVKDMAISYTDNVQVVFDTNCTGYATFILPPYIIIDAEILLKNNVGATNSWERSFDTNPLRNVTNGTGSSPSIQCLFTDDIMITNNYSIGCVAYYTEMSQPVYALRENYASHATMNITDITNSGYFNMTVISLPISGHCRDFVISVEPNEPSNNSTCTPKPDGGQYCLQRNVALGAGISIAILLLLGWLGCFIASCIAWCKRGTRGTCNIPPNVNGNIQVVGSNAENEIRPSEATNQVDLEKQGTEQKSQQPVAPNDDPVSPTLEMNDFSSIPTSKMPRTQSTRLPSELDNATDELYIYDEPAEVESEISPRSGELVSHNQLKSTQSGS